MDQYNLPYMNKKRLAETFDISKATVQQRIGEMESCGRYGPYAILRDGQILQINVLAFVDWLKYRRLWQDKNLKKYVPEFVPQKVAESMGLKNDRVSLRRVAI